MTAATHARFLAVVARAMAVPMPADPEVDLSRRSRRGRPRRAHQELAGPLSGRVPYNPTGDGVDATFTVRPGPRRRQERAT